MSGWSDRRRRGVVAVTGAAGSLGAGVVRRLAARPDVRRVLALDVCPGEPVEGAVEWRRADVRDPVLDRELAGVETLVHVAGLHHPDEDPTVRRATNVRGTANVLAAAGSAGVRRVVLVTSAMVYGAHADNSVPLDEHAPIRAVRDGSLVGDFVEIERLVESHRSAGTRPDVTVLRPATLTGPGADNVLTRHFESPRLLHVRGSRPLWQFCHMSDLESACELAAVGAVDGVVNVAPDGWLTQEEVERVARKHRVELSAAVAFSAAERLHRAGVIRAPASELSYLAHPWVVSNRKLRAAGWTPEHDNATALRAHLDAAGTHLALGGRRLGRDEATRAAAGATLALIASAAVVRRARKRRR